ncbi:mediator of RNA polymerase II transcription subunit 29-like [Bactrocera neohumeralis]|uniref:mediator of RNA polymerase II transcription subunit 29-like n=1 Tax=Bactrocera neohumeralis TaxID=98809 RepID=UPI002165D044|nr:mediator of RNA polymerase II transcription subunit 29-like [Bactrocera neohumeralis]
MQQQQIQLQHQMQQQQEQIHSQQLHNQQQHNQQSQQLVLRDDKVISHFRHLKPFSGSKGDNLLALINAVERGFYLCNNKSHMEEFVTQIVVNEKLIGEARRCIQQLAYNSNWTEVKQRSKQRHQPEESYSQIFNRCILRLVI